ncbi:DUF3017 domain-containing protein [Streptomyces sp. NPDC021080]|uniref:DUF3017 domain-containing protein n=1 Tax=Streptomyces sp. NPDC021080 TaxID=3365110 RepID=UPI00379178FF
MRDAVTGAEAEPEDRAEGRSEGQAGAGAEAEVEAAVGAEVASEAEAAVASGSRARAGAGGASGAEGDRVEEETVRDAISAPDSQGKPRRTTRRFPLFTRDTARPEGGGRAASGDAPAPARQWPILAVLSTVALGLLLTALDVFRVGTILIGAALLGGAVMRWMLPSVGMLAVRSRFTDMLTYTVLGGAIVVLALMAQPGPLLEIPFLDDTLHFTVR